MDFSSIVYSKNAQFDCFYYSSLPSSSSDSYHPTTFHSCLQGHFCSLLWERRTIWSVLEPLENLQPKSSLQDSWSIFLNRLASLREIPAIWRFGLCSRSLHSGYSRAESYWDQSFSTRYLNHEINSWECTCNRQENVPESIVMILPHRTFKAKYSMKKSNNCSNGH